jgi:hypothetical protein
MMSSGILGSLIKSFQYLGGRSVKNVGRSFVLRGDGVFGLQKGLLVAGIFLWGVCVKDVLQLIGMLMKSFV